MALSVDDPNFEILDLPYTYEVDQRIRSTKRIEGKRKKIWVSRKQKVMIPKKFNIEENFIPYLQEHGYVVLKNIVDSNALEEVLNLFWNDLEGLESGIDRNDISTWGDDNWPGCLHRGFFCSHSFAQREASWKLRTLPGVKETFAKIWGTEDLITSMDIMIGYRPWYARKDIILPTVEPLHVDQSPTYSKGFHCIQGMLILRDVEPEIGGLQIVPGTNTHEVQARLAKDYGSSGDFLPLRKTDPYMVDNMGQLILAKAGDFIIWDSRTVHGGNVGPGFPADSEVNGLARLCQTICMMPRAYCEESIISRRRRFFENGCSSTHWPIECAKHANFDSKGKNIVHKPYVPLPLNEEIEKLLGMEGQTTDLRADINPAIH